MEKQDYRNYMRWLTSASRYELEFALIQATDLLNVFKDENIIKQTKERIALCKNELQARNEAGE